MKTEYPLNWQKGAFAYLVCALAKQYVVTCDDFYEHMPNDVIFTKFDGKNDFVIEKCLSLPFLVISTAPPESSTRNIFIRLFPLAIAERVHGKPGFIPKLFREQALNDKKIVLDGIGIIRNYMPMRIDSIFIAQARFRTPLPKLIMYAHGIYDEAFLELCHMIDHALGHLEEKLHEFALMNPKLMTGWNKNNGIYELYEKFVTIQDDYEKVGKYFHEALVQFQTDLTERISLKAS